MIAQEAREKVRATVNEAINLCREKGLAAFGKAYYCDKSLIETTEFNDKVILLFGALSIGAEDMDTDDYCSCGLCCETKTGLVDDEELEKEIAAFKQQLDEILAEVSSAPSAKDKIAEINLRQDREAAESMQEFNLEMRKVKLKLYSALGVIAAIVVGVLVLSIVL